MPKERPGIWVDMKPGLNNLIDDLARFRQTTRKDFVTETIEAEVYRQLTALPFDVEELLAGLDEQYPGGNRLETFKEIESKINAKEVTPYAPVETVSEDISGG